METLELKAAKNGWTRVMVVEDRPALVFKVENAQIIVAQGGGKSKGLHSDLIGLTLQEWATISEACWYSLPMTRKDLH